MTMSAPASASPRAIALPSPLLPPVINATLPAKLKTCRAMAASPFLHTQRTETVPLPGAASGRGLLQLGDRIGKWRGSQSPAGPFCPLSLAEPLIGLNWTHLDRRASYHYCPVPFSG